MKLITVIVNIVIISSVPNIEPSTNNMSTQIEAITTGTDIRKLNFKL